MNQSYGAGYLPTGAASSPGLYNMALVRQQWLPSWASLKGGIMGPLYAPRIDDPATVAAIMNGAWDFSTAGSMFDPQGNRDLGPGAIPNHFYSGRSMTLHGYGDAGGFGGVIDAWRGWVGGLAPLGKIAYFAGLGLAVLALWQPLWFLNTSIGWSIRKMLPKFMRRSVNIRGLSSGQVTRLGKGTTQRENRGKKRRSRKSRRRSSRR